MSGYAATGLPTLHVKVPVVRRAGDETQSARPDGILKFDQIYLVSWVRQLMRRIRTRFQTRDDVRSAQTAAFQN